MNTRTKQWAVIASVQFYSQQPMLFSSSLFFYACVSTVRTGVKSSDVCVKMQQVKVKKNVAKENYSVKAQIPEKSQIKRICKVICSLLPLTSVGATTETAHIGDVLETYFLCWPREAGAPQNLSLCLLQILIFFYHTLF